jgi:hypothetical protein
MDLQFLDPTHSQYDSFGRESAHRKDSTYTRDNTNTDICTSTWIRTHDPSVWAGEDSLCLRLW